MSVGTLARVFDRSFPQIVLAISFAFQPEIRFRQTSDEDPLDVIEADVVGAPIVEPGGPGVGMVGHLARLFQRAAIFEVGSDAGTPKGMVADRRGDAGALGPAAHHGMGLTRRDSTAGQPLMATAGPGGDRGKQRGFRLMAEPARIEIGVQIGLEIVVAGHLMTLAALFVEPHPEAALVDEDAFDPHAGRGADPGEGIDHEGDQGPVPQAGNPAGVDGVEELASLVGCEHRGFATPDAMLRAPHGGGRVEGQDAASCEIVEQGADGRQVALHGRGRVGLAELLDIGRDVQGVDVRDGQDAGGHAPGQENAHVTRIGPAGVRVADGGGEELHEAPARPIAARGDEGWKGGTRRDADQSGHLASQGLTRVRPQPSKPPESRVTTAASWAWAVAATMRSVVSIGLPICRRTAKSSA